jgi:hypothetical protein
MANKKEPKFDPNKGFMTRDGNEVIAVTFKLENKLMGIVIDKDGQNGAFCSWDMATGHRIGIGRTGEPHIQDLTND